MNKCENVKLTVQHMTYASTPKTTMRNFGTSKIFLYNIKIDDLTRPSPMMEIMFKMNFA